MVKSTRISWNICFFNRKTFSIAVCFEPGVAQMTSALMRGSLWSLCYLVFNVITYFGGNLVSKKLKKIKKSSDACA